MTTALQDSHPFWAFLEDAGLGRAETCGYHLVVSQGPEDADWDAFLAKVPCGHHVQTSLWAQVKRPLGWHATRVVAMRRGEIVGGAQVLMRPMHLVGNVAYVHKGPLLADDDPVLVRLVLNGIDEIARTNGVRYLAVQPPRDSALLQREMAAIGLQPSLFPEIMPGATVFLDLSVDSEGLLAGMTPQRRYSIRAGMRKGVTVREGTERDLPEFYRQVLATGQRQNFTTYPESYFTRLWQVFAPRGYARLFVAEVDGESVSAQLAITFGDTLVNKLSAWSGRYGNLRPNEVLQWGVIEWAKAHGFRHYDFEGIDVQAARAVLNGQPVPDDLKDTVTSFKLSFGGQVTLLPGVYDYVYNPVFRWAYASGFPRFAQSSLVRKTLNRMRTSS